MHHSLHGKSFIGRILPEQRGRAFRSVSPLTNEPLEPEFYECTVEAVDWALRLAEEAFVVYRRISAAARADFLERIADEILAAGDELIERAHLESGLSRERLTGERARTMNQLKLFAAVAREGSWRDARIDTAQPERKPLAKPDLRRMMIPLGPVVVFGASNFPLAFSVAGGDTASALAAGCPVIVKGHEAHPGTSELVAAAMGRAVAHCGMPDGVFSMLHGSGEEIGVALVSHPLARAVGFTGSRTAGRALYDAAARRSAPIPVFAEMSSLNPIFILPGALREQGGRLAEGLRASVTTGAGQFCTKPGLIFGIGGTDLQRFASELSSALSATPPATMLHAGIRRAYEGRVQTVERAPGIVALATSENEVSPEKTEGAVKLFATDVEDFMVRPELHEEIFGPATLLITSPNKEGLVQAAARLEGQLTATLHGTPEDLATAGDLIEILERKAGRLLVNGYPTGVEVCPAMHHGGPYPATTDERFTSVGTAAIARWLRPVCYQNFPESALPVELHDANPAGIMRLVNGEYTRGAIGANG